MIKLNPKYKEKTIWNPNKEYSKGTFAWIWYDKKIIEYYPRWQYFFIWPLMKIFVKKHERAHSWEIRNCLSNSKFCIMFEDDDTWTGKLKTVPYQILNLGRFCNKCKDCLNEKIKER